MDSIETMKHKDESVEAGRAFVAAYVDFMHYVEGIHAAAAKSGHHHEAEAKTEAHEH